MTADFSKGGRVCARQYVHSWSHGEDGASPSGLKSFDSRLLAFIRGSRFIGSICGAPSSLLDEILTN